MNIIFYLLAIVLGIVFGYLMVVVVSRIKDKKHIKKMVERIEKNEGTFFLDGRRVDLMGKPKGGEEVIKKRSPGKKKEKAF